MCYDGVVDIDEFLLARIAEDEQRAETEAVLRDGDPYYAPEGLEQSAFDRHINPARVLADCQAKRRIVHEWMGGNLQSFPVYVLAEVYADHPDFDETWLPVS